MAEQDLQDLAAKRAAALEVLESYTNPVSTESGTVLMSFRLPAEVRDAFREIAKAKRQNPSAILRAAIGEWLTQVDTGNGNNRA